MFQNHGSTGDSMGATNPCSFTRDGLPSGVSLHTLGFCEKRRYFNHLFNADLAQHTKTYVALLCSVIFLLPQSALSATFPLLGLKRSCSSSEQPVFPLPAVFSGSPVYPLPLLLRSNSLTKATSGDESFFELTVPGGRPSRQGRPDILTLKQSVMLCPQSE